MLQASPRAGSNAPPLRVPPRSYFIEGIIYVALTKPIVMTMHFFPLKHSCGPLENTSVAPLKTLLYDHLFLVGHIDDML